MVCPLLPGVIVIAVNRGLSPITLLKIRVGRGKYFGPGLGVRALMLGRETVCCAVQHIQLVDKLVYDHVVPIQCARGFCILP